MRFLYDKELVKRYYKDIIKNILLLLATSALSIAAPLVLRDAVDYESSTGFRREVIGYYLILITVLYFIKFLYNRFSFWFSEKFKNYETVNLYQKIFHMSYDKINEMEPTYIAERVRDTVNTIFSLYCNSLTGIFVSVLTVGGRRSERSRGD